MSYVEMASKIGRNKRQEMEDSMKRKSIERQLAALAKQNPEAVVNIARQRAPGGGAYAVAPGGPAAAIAAKMRGSGANNGGSAGAPGAGSPAAVGNAWRVSDAERLAGDTYNVGRDNSPVPSDLAMQQKIRNDRLAAGDAAIAASAGNAALDAKYLAPLGASTATGAVAAADPKAAKKAQDEALKIQKEIAREKKSSEPSEELLAILEQQLAAATSPAAPAVAPAQPRPAPFTVQTPRGPVISNRRDAYYPPSAPAPDAALAAKFNPASIPPGPDNPTAPDPASVFNARLAALRGGGAPAAAPAQPAPVAPAPGGPQMNLAGRIAGGVVNAPRAILDELGMARQYTTQVVKESQAELEKRLEEERKKKKG